MEEIFRSYKDKVYGFVLSHLCDEELAKDLTQEVFLSLCLNKEKLGGIEDLNRYVFLTTKSRVIDYLRKAAREKAYRESLIGSWENTAPGIEKKIDREHYRSLLDRTINKLPPRQQAVYKMSKLQGLSLKDIARELNLSPNTVKNHLVQANKFVRGDINPESAFILLVLGLF